MLDPLLADLRRIYEGNAWHGPSVLEALDAFSPAPKPHDLALRMPVQAIYKFDDRRIVAGRVESGRIGVGDDILIMPAAKPARSNTAATSRASATIWPARWRSRTRPA